MEHLEKMLEAHIEDEKSRYDGIQNDLKFIRENHLVHMQATVERLTVDIAWVKMIVTGTLGTVIAAVIALLFSKL